LLTKFYEFFCRGVMWSTAD